MAKKWNLQDIQPPERARRGAKRMRAREEDSESATPRQHDAAPRERDAAPEERPEAEREESARQARRTPARRARQEGSRETYDSIPVADGRRKKRIQLIIGVVVFVLIVAGSFIASALMSGAEVTAYPRTTEKNVNARFTMHKQPQQSELGFELLTLEADGERQVEASGQEEVNQQAEGTIFIYNEFSREPIRLVKNTRFASPEGLIYKIEESAVVPGYTENEQGELVPGVVSAEVFAEGPGEQYNIDPVRFTIPGFEGEPEYDAVYGESTDAMTGGFAGERFIIDEGELETARQALHTELRDALLARLPEERPAGFVLFDNAVTFDFESLPAVEYGDDLATIKERGALQVPIIREEDLAGYLAEQTVAGYEGLPVRLTDYDALTFGYTSPTTTVSDISNRTELEFTLSGDIKIVWTFQTDELKADLLGVEKTALPQILGKYPAIERAEAVIRPFWKSSFPRNMNEITVTEVLDEE